MSLWYRFCRSLAFSLGRILGGLTVEGLENVPAEGSFLLTSNHIGLLDPPVIASACPREVGFAAKKELFAVPILGPLIRSLNSIPVDRAKVSVTTFREFGRFLGQGKGLMYFPEGTRSRTGELGKAKVGVGMILAQYPVAILPVVVEGTNSLSRALVRRGRLRVIFGPPYTLPREVVEPSEERREQYRRIADLVLDRIRRLKEGISSSDDRGTDRPAREAARPASRGSAASGRSDPNTKAEGMEPRG